MTTAFLKAGVPINKMECFHVLLEEDSTCLMSTSNMRQLVPFILDQEISRIKDQIAGRQVSITFDGTTRV